MKLRKKHIGKLFDVQGGDGSWVYQLVDVKGDNALFYNFGNGGYEIDNRKRHKDWQEFEPMNPWPKDWIADGWKRGRRMP